MGQLATVSPAGGPTVYVQTSSSKQPAAGSVGTDLEHHEFRLAPPRSPEQGQLHAQNNAIRI